MRCSSAPTRRTRAGGFILPLVMVYVVLATLIGWGMFALAVGENQTFGREQIAAQAFYAAEAGLKNAQAYLHEPNRGDWSDVPVALYTDKPLASLPGATYTVALSERQADSVHVVSTGTYRGKSRRVAADLTRGN